MKKYLSLLFVMFASAVFASEPIVIKLWPDGKPDSNGLESTGEKLDSVSGWISGVSEPYLYVYPAREPNGRMVVACPGGGYAGLASHHEGHDWAGWMNERGYGFAVLKYRMPEGNSAIPLEDARRAIEIVRERAGEWGVSPDNVGVMGFSAGGHLAGSLANLYGDDRYRPDFQILFYPVITMGSATHEGSRDNLLGRDAGEDAKAAFSLENRVTPATPRAFVVLAADDDVVPASNSLNYVQSLVHSSVPVELHVYPTGGHGWGFRDSYRYGKDVKEALSKWLESF